MSGAFIEVKTSGSELAFFAKAAAGADAPEDMLLEIGEALKSDVTNRGRTSTAPDGTPWLPSQRAIETGGKTLIDTNTLLPSATYDVVNDVLLFGLTEVYGAIHQFGGKAGRGKKVTIPARPIIGVAAPQQKSINKILTRWTRRLFD